MVSMTIKGEQPADVRLEFWLERVGQLIQLKVNRSSQHSSHTQSLLEISSAGSFRRVGSVNGLPELEVVSGQLVIN